MATIDICNNNFSRLSRLNQKLDQVSVSKYKITIIP